VPTTWQSAFSATAATPYVVAGKVPSPGGVCDDAANARRLTAPSIGIPPIKTEAGGQPFAKMPTWYHEVMSATSVGTLS
jgi:hypothetical protein